MIRVFIADDHPIVREGLKGILGACEGMEVVGEASSGVEALEGLRALPADVALLDLSMPGPGVFELLEQIKSEHPRLRILVVSMQPEEIWAVRTLKAGASGFVAKDRSPEELEAAIRRIDDGGRYVSQALAERLALGLLEEDSATPPHERLSNREYEVLCLLGEGKIVKEIAAQLSLSPKTVSTYRSRLLEKLGAKTTAELIRYAIQHELTV